MKKALQTLYGIPEDKCTVSYPFVTLRPGRTSMNELADLFPSGYRHVVYSGALGEKHKPRVLFEFFRELCQMRDEVVCHVFSQGTLFESLRRESQTQGIERLQFHDLVPESSLDEMYARSTVQVIPQAEGTGAGAFPSKLPNLLMAGVPVFAICDSDSELATVVSDVGIGRTVHTWDKQQLASAMCELLDDECGNSRDVSRARVAAHIEQRFSVQGLVEQILNGQ